MITRLQFALKKFVLRIMFAACDTGISLKLSTSPSARCLAMHWLISCLPECYLYQWENRILAFFSHSSSVYLHYQEQNLQEV
jgi:hypothetical protein